MLHATPPALQRSTVQNRSRCHFLELPAELRNIIYDLAFEPTPGPVDLLKAEPPLKNLLLTCRKVHGEARLLYREAYRRYWTNTKFTASKCNYDEKRKLLDWVYKPENEQNLQHIERVGIFGRFDSALVWNTFGAGWTSWYRGLERDYLQIQYQVVHLQEAEYKRIIPLLDFKPSFLACWRGLIRLSTKSLSVAMKWEIEKVLVKGRLTSDQMDVALNQ